jgi:hypothetical protein
MDPHERATSVWYRIAGLISREQKDLAVENIEAEIPIGATRDSARRSEAGAERRADRDRAATAGAGGAEYQAEVVMSNLATYSRRLFASAVSGRPALEMSTPPASIEGCSCSGY